MAILTKFNLFSSDVAAKVHNLNSDALKVMLSNVAPVATNHLKADITEISVGNGYTAGGAVATFVSGNNAAGLYTLVLAPVTFSASGGSIATFQFATLYNSTAPGGNLIGWWDYGASIIVTNGNAFIVQLDQTNGVLTLQ